MWLGVIKLVPTIVCHGGGMLGSSTAGVVFWWGLTESIMRAVVVLVVIVVIVIRIMSNVHCIPTTIIGVGICVIVVDWLLGEVVKIVDVEQCWVGWGLGLGLEGLGVEGLGLGLEGLGLVLWFIVHVVIDIVIIKG